MIVTRNKDLDTAVFMTHPANGAVMGRCRETAVLLPDEEMFTLSILITVVYHQPDLPSQQAALPRNGSLSAIADIKAR